MRVIFVVALGLPAYLRAYPTGLGVQIRKIYQQALKRPARAPLRFGIAVPAGKSDLELFSSLPVGDVWSDADMASVFEYLYACKYVRRRRSKPFIHPSGPFPALPTPLGSCRIPDDWKQPMKIFREELLVQAAGMAFRFKLLITISYMSRV